MNPSPSVAITRCSTYDDEEVQKAVELVCEAALLPSVEGKTVLLKPNILSDAPPEKAITTRPEILRALIRHLFAKGAARVLVGDSPGIHGPSFIPKTSGIGKVCAQEGAQWCEFAREPVMHRIPGTYGLRLPLPKILCEVDLIISVAKMKTHQLMYATGSVKNLFGMVPGLHKSRCHMLYPTRESFSRMLAGLYALVKPQFAVMDAIICMEGAGPAPVTADSCSPPPTRRRWMSPRRSSWATRRLAFPSRASCWTAILRTGEKWRRSPTRSSMPTTCISPITNASRCKDEPACSVPCSGRCSPVPSNSDTSEANRSRCSTVTFASAAANVCRYVRGKPWLLTAIARSWPTMTRASAVIAATRYVPRMRSRSNRCQGESEWTCRP